MTTHLTGPEILGTIDLEALKPKKKTSSKEKKGQKKEKQGSQSKPAKAVETPKPEPKKEEPTPVVSKPEEPVVEHIKTVVNPLKGPKILGTIDLSLLQQPSANGKNDHRGGDSDKKKKKRKRVAKPVKSSSNANLKDDKDKKQKQESEKVEISAEDIHRRIKETKMRLESNTKKTATAKPVDTSQKKGVEKMIAIAESKIGCPYSGGAKGPNRFDCSGFVYYCMKQAGFSGGYMTSRTWRTTSRYKRITSMSQIQRGDILVFKGNSMATGHVGIYLGGGRMIDASSGAGQVRITSSVLSGTYWKQHFLMAYRIG